MNQEPFPKPQPADPLPLEKWLRRTDRAESGREAFFRGRNQEFETFRSALLSLNDGIIGGGTMIFQGAPGAGKSALLGECMEAVRCHSTPDDPWVTASIRPGTLRSATQFMEIVVKAIKEENKRLKKEFPDSDDSRSKKVLKLGGKLLKALADRGGSIGPVTVGAKQQEEDRLDSNLTAQWVFSTAAPLLKEFHMVIMVDEAQNTPINDLAKEMIECLHYPPDEIPLVAAFFGLSDTEEVLRECGLSRLPRGRLLNLERLSLEDSASAVYGVFGAYEIKGAEEDREAWVNSLAKLSQGWPQHINSVSVAAIQVIQEHGGRIMMEHLDEALKRGQEQMNVYYRGRLAAGSSDAWVYKQLALAMEDGGGSLANHEIGRLTEFARKESSQALDSFLTNALHAGLLAPDPDPEIFDHYRIPIPSMGDYLRTIKVSMSGDFQN